MIELIIIIVVLGIGAVALMSLQSQVVRGRADDSDLQIGAQLLQECAEHILLTRRRGAGYAAINSTVCSGVTAFGGFGTPTVTFPAPDPYTGAGCPAGATCRRAVISVTKGASTISSARVMVVNY